MSKLNRRDFMKVAGVTAAAGAVACDPRVPMENVLPYVAQPDQIVPGTPTFFSTLCNECPTGCGVIARNREGRIVKLDGNPDHPANQGSLCSRGTQGILATYSPDRFAGPMVDGAASDWDKATAAAVAAVKGARSSGKQVAWLGQSRTGATGALVKSFMAALGARPLFWEPTSGVDSLRGATKRLFGLDTVPSFELAGAHTILSFGAEVLSTWGGIDLRKGWADSRDPAKGGFVSRTICIEPRAGNTSAMADHHFACTPGSESAVAFAISGLIKAKKDGRAAKAQDVGGIPAAKIDQIVAWMTEAPSVALPGGVHTSANPGQLADAVLAINLLAGNIGKTVTFGQTPNVADFCTHKDVQALIADCKAGKVGVLFLDGADPVYQLPAELGAEAALAGVQIIAFSNEPSDSLNAKAIVLPPGTTLESWGDAEATTGWHTLQQATMNPLKDTRQMGDVLLAVAKSAGIVPAPVPVAAETEAPAAGAEAEAAAGEEAEAVPMAAAVVLPTLDAADFRTWLMGWWKAVVQPKSGGTGSFDDFWVAALKRGGFFVKAPRTGAEVKDFSPGESPKVIGGTGDKTLMVFPHPFLHDGRHANKPWAQEVPEPLSSFTWGTWVEIHPNTAAQLGLEDDDAVVVTTEKGSVEVGWFGSPGIREDSVAVVMGNGHKASGRYTRFGANPMALLPDDADAYGAQRLVTKASISKGGKHAMTQYIGNIDQDGRGINYVVSKEDLGKGYDEHTIFNLHHPPVDERLKKAGLTDMYPEPAHPTYRFAMAIDLNRCTGCGACETACFAENNLPIVGPEQIALSRHMGWLRLSRYWEGEGETPDVRFQPVMCQHCSHAPCEGVCPVLATYHNLDGLNAMVYNRCVGTRYCANNCPYTARRFNYHTYKWPESYNLMLNPDVSTREMGVMEKCSFCVHKLREVKDQYRDLGKTAPDAALQKVTACASACPTDAITFGNANDVGGKVAKLFKNERAYAMLGELNTKPGVRYLARVNHIESLAAKAHHGSSHGGGHGEDHGGGHGAKEDAGHGADHGEKH